MLGTYLLQKYAAPLNEHERAARGEAWFGCLDLHSFQEIC
jgi:hypothetical protein